MRITMRFTLGIMTKYIDRNPSNHQVLSCEQQIIALSKVRNVNNANILEYKNVVFSLVATTRLQP
jgi:hypothetical protein